MLYYLMAEGIIIHSCKIKIIKYIYNFSCFYICMCYNKSMVERPHKLKKVTEIIFFPRWRIINRNVIFNLGGNKMTDKTLVCVDCGQEFIFTEGEQAFYKEKGFDNEPKRCVPCRRAKKDQNNRK